MTAIISASAFIPVVKTSTTLPIENVEDFLFLVGQLAGQKLFELVETQTRFKGTGAQVFLRHFLTITTYKFSNNQF